MRPHGHGKQKLENGEVPARSRPHSHPGGAPRCPHGQRNAYVDDVRPSCHSRPATNGKLHLLYSHLYNLGQAAVPKAMLWHLAMYLYHVKCIMCLY